MFNGCTKLLSLNLASFNLVKAVRYANMFVGCYNLTLTIVPEHCSQIMSLIPDYVTVIEVT